MLTVPYLLYILCTFTACSCVNLLLSSVHNASGSSTASQCFA